MGSVFGSQFVMLICLQTVPPKKFGGKSAFSSFASACWGNLFFKCFWIPLACLMRCQSGKHLLAAKANLVLLIQNSSLKLFFNSIAILPRCFAVSMRANRYSEFFTANQGLKMMIGSIIILKNNRALSMVDIKGCLGLIRLCCVVGCLEQLFDG